MAKILIIDDDQQICKTLVLFFKRMGHEVSDSFTIKQGLNKLSKENFDVIFLDVILPDGNGLEAIETIRDFPFAPEIIIMTGEGNLDGAEFAMKSKAWDYIQKNEPQQKFKLSLKRALRYRQQKADQPSIKSAIKRDLIIGQSTGILKCLDLVSTAAKNTLPVMVTGKTGTGKELFARAIHENSDRHKKEFVVVDCAALPEHLVESTLFGHVKGAFTGAESNNPGLLALADGGTLFLDEIGELPLNVQKKFLRAFQEKKFRPVGSKKEVSSDFRFVGATHRNLLKMVKNREFRQDLYFRVCSLEIRLPALKNRQKDISLIAMDHIKTKNSLLGQEAFKLSEGFMEELQGYDWPGNVRELKNTIDLACSKVLHGETLFPKHLPEKIRIFNLKQKITTRNLKQPVPSSGSLTPLSEILPLKKHIDKTKHDYILNLLHHTKGNIKQSCLLSGLSRGHLYILFKKFGIKP